MEKQKILSGIFGVATGDALGVPAEFKSRELLAKNPVTDMAGYGTHNMPAGTWSDDTSMMLAALDALTEGYDPDAIMERFQKWLVEEEYTPYGEVFDAGMICRRAIYRYVDGKKAVDCGSYGFGDNGNGSLMWIIAACLFMAKKEMQGELTEKEAVRRIHECSGLTHAHVISKAACGLYYFMVRELLEEQEKDLQTVLQNGLDRAFVYYRKNEWYNFEDAFEHYICLRNLSDLAKLDVEEIISGGYVVDTMEAALWCLLNTNDYRSCVLKAVNLGSDTDTVAAVAGGLAGLFYGYENIPRQWKEMLARREWIEKLCEKAAQSF